MKKKGSRRSRPLSLAVPIAGSSVAFQGGDIGRPPDEAYRGGVGERMADHEVHARYKRPTAPSRQSHHKRGGQRVDHAVAQVDEAWRFLQVSIPVDVKLQAHPDALRRRDGEGVVNTPTA